MPLKSALETRFRRHPQRLFLAVSALLVLGLYWHTLNAPFVYDDLDQVVNNPNLGSWHNFTHRFLLQPVTLASSLLAYAGSIYRPLFWLSLFLDHALWGLNPAGFHSTNLLLHLLNGNLAFALLRRLKVPGTVAAATALLWLALPTNTEVVAWVSARSYELCTLFCLSCLLSALTFVRTQKWLFLLACFLATAAAALSHELGIIVAPLLLLIAFRSPRAESRRFAAPLAATLLALISVAALRAHVGVKTFSALASPAWSALALGKYLAFTLFLLHMSVERSTSITLTHAHPWLLPQLALLAAALAGAVALRRITPLPLFGLLWFLLCIAPFILFMNYQGVAERFAYLASLGLVTAILGLFTFRTRPELRTALIACVSIWAAASAVRTGLRAADWADPVALYRSSLVATPNSPALHFNLAYSLREAGHLQEARTEYQRTLQINPNYPNTYASLGDVDLALGSFADAQSNYARALAQHPDDTAVLLNSASAYANAGDLANAEATFRRVLALDPNSSAAHTNLGVLYMGQNRQNDAMHQFAMAIDLKTKDPTPFYDLAVIFQGAGRGDLAMVLYRKVLELKPNDPDTLHNMQLIQQAH